MITQHRKLLAGFAILSVILVILALYNGLRNVSSNNTATAPAREAASTVFSSQAFKLPEPPAKPLPDSAAKNAKDRAMAAILSIRENANKRNPPPSDKEIEDYIVKMNRSPESLGWAYVQNGSVAYLKEGLTKDAENPFLHFLASLSTISDETALVSSSKEWLKSKAPGLYAAVLLRENKSFTHEDIQSLNQSSFDNTPDDVLRSQSETFLTEQRQTTKEFASDNTGIPDKYSLLNILALAALSSNDPALKLVAALASSGSTRLNDRISGLAIEGVLYNKMEAKDLEPLLQESKQTLIDNNALKTKELMALSQYRDQILQQSDLERKNTYYNLRASLGEIEALKQMQVNK